MSITKTTNWFTIKVQSNRERSIAEKLESDMIREFEEEVNFLIPSKEYLTIKNGKKIIKSQLLYPGYLFVETKSIDKLNHLIKGTSGASQVIKDSKGVPTPLRKDEIERMLGAKEANKAIVSKNTFVVDEQVEIINGPFSKFKGTITSIDPDKGKVSLEVKIFGRGTNVDLTVEDIVKVEEVGEDGKD